MRHMRWIVAVALVLGVALGVQAQTATRVSIQGNADESTLEQQTDVALTVYNENRALVRDQRSLELATGTVALKFMDVAEQVQPETVSLKSLAAPGSVVVLEQNYEYDLMSPEKLLEKYVGRKVTLINKSKDVDFFEVEADLLSVNNGPVYRIDGQIYLGHPGTVVLPELPDALIAKPTLVWRLENTRAQQDLEVTYLTGGISWKADYVLSLARDEKTLDIDGWVTLDNRSGATYADARVKLVAGDVNIVREPPMEKMRMLAAVPMDAAAMPVEETFAEYHLYTLPRRATIKQNQTKQVSLLRAEGIKATKKYEYRGQQHYFMSRIPRIEKDKVAVFLEFRNSADNALGIPLPAGTMRVYQPDSEGMPQFAGEDRLAHTPKDEEVRLKLGNAFDVVADRTQTNYSALGPAQHESSFEIVLRNHKDTAIAVDIVEPMMGDWSIVSNSHDYTKKDAFTAVFTVPVPANGETKVTYTVRVRMR